MDIGAGPIPLDDVPVEISERDRPSSEPTVLSLATENSVFGLIRLTGAYAFHPLGQTPLLVVGMQIFHPTKSNGRTWRGAGVFIEPAADVVSGAIRLPAEDDIGSRLHNRV